MLVNIVSISTEWLSYNVPQQRTKIRSKDKVKWKPTRKVSYWKKKKHKMYVCECVKTRIQFMIKIG